MGSPDPSDFARVMKEARGRAAQMGLSNAEVARRAQLDPATVGDFFSGKRWPRVATLNKIEVVIGLESGSLEAAVEGRELSGADVSDVQTLAVTVPDSVPLESLSESQVDYLRSAATLGLMRAYAEIEVQKLRSEQMDQTS